MQWRFFCESSLFFSLFRFTEIKIYFAQTKNYFSETKIHFAESLLWITQTLWEVYVLICGSWKLAFDNVERFFCAVLFLIEETLSAFCNYQLLKKSYLCEIILKQNHNKNIMKVVILTQYFPPEVGAPQNRLYELAVRLKERGIDVSILTAMPNYPQMEIHKNYKGKCFCKEEMDGMTIYRSWIYVSKLCSFSSS